MDEWGDTVRSSWRSQRGGHDKVQLRIDWLHADGGQELIVGKGGVTVNVRDRTPLKTTRDQLEQGARVPPREGLEEDIQGLLDVAERNPASKGADKIVDVGIPTARAEREVGVVGAEREENTTGKCPPENQACEKLPPPRFPLNAR